MLRELNIHPSWKKELESEFAQPYFAELESFIDQAYGRETVYPVEGKIFEAFNRTPFDRVKVVILGQDPYHEEGQAAGLAFYVPPGIKTPPSLANIAMELGKMPDLMSWAEEGVLLLNATLTVAAHRPLSHHGKGWEKFTDAVIRILSEKKSNLAFILWGGNARKKGAAIDRSRHFVVESAHPSPLSAYRGFFGSKPFARVNEYLSRCGIAPVEW